MICIFEVGRLYLVIECISWFGYVEWYFDASTLLLKDAWGIGYTICVAFFLTSPENSLISYVNEENFVNYVLAGKY
jgi:hypothetical protein